MKGNSWLKSSNPLVDSLLPSIGESKFDNYSRDSLDASKNDNHTKKPRCVLNFILFTHKVELVYYSKLETACTRSSTDEESGMSGTFIVGVWWDIEN